MIWMQANRIAKFKAACAAADVDYDGFDMNYDGFGMKANQSTK